MKKKMLWQSPVTEVQVFTPNCYVAACGYTWKCVCKTDANNGSYNYLYSDTNGNGQLDSSDELVYGNGWRSFSGCGEEHQLTSTTIPSFNGFVSTKSAGSTSRNQKIQQVFWWGDSSDPHACYDPASAKNVS